jgi:hypothetical protein
MSSLYFSNVVVQRFVIEGVAPFIAAGDPKVLGRIEDKLSVHAVPLAPVRLGAVPTRALFVVSGVLAWHRSSSGGRR